MAIEATILTGNSGFGWQCVTRDEAGRMILWTPRVGEPVAESAHTSFQEMLMVGWQGPPGEFSRIFAAHWPVATAAFRDAGIFAQNDRLQALFRPAGSWGGGR